MKVSVVIPTYNAVNYICETVECWLNQTKPVFEIIIQDDHSNDGTWELLNSKYATNQFVKLYRNKINLGIGKNWNECYDKVTGDYVVIFNADDLVDNEFIALSLKLFATHPSVDYVTHGYYNTYQIAVKDQLSNRFKKHEGIIDNLLTMPEEKEIKPHWNFTLIKRNVLESLKVNGKLFFETQVCDAMLWFELYKQGKKGYFSGKIMGYYRLHDDNSSKIKFGEFESTYLYMVPKYPEIFALIHPKSLKSAFILLFSYLFQCVKHLHQPKVKIALNIIKYRI